MAPQTQNKDAGQAAVKKAEEKGYLGTKVDPLPNSAHSLESGPDSPPVHEARRDTDIANLDPEA